MALLTFTNSHSIADDLGSLLERQRAALRAFWKSRVVTAGLSRLGCIGRVSSTEVTFGHGSGWHPHVHVLLFIDGASDVDLLRSEFCGTWFNCCERVGLDCSMSRGLDIRGGEAAGAYVAKLGLEVALAVRKRGRGVDRFGVWELLQACDDGHTWAASRFVEFASVMKGRRHLVWSAGLRSNLALASEWSDEAIMAKPGEADEALYAKILRDTWRGICRAGVRGEVLQLLGLDDLDEARNLLLACGVDPFGLRRVCSDVSDCDTLQGVNE